MFYIGLDLSGPANSAETALVAFKSSKQGFLSRCSMSLGADDNDILYSARRYKLEGDIVVGIDAPLSYNIGGGDRQSDSELRKKIISAGLKSGSVMPPTMTRMAYLTLRGISVARLLTTVSENIKIVEVHPNAAMVLRGAPTDDVINYKRNEQSRNNLLKWLGQQGLKNIDNVSKPTDHYVAACACALAAWKWYQNKSVWIHRLEQPFHPFDYAC
jgi:predicted nuclease with RNAse H fold